MTDTASASSPKRTSPGKPAMRRDYRIHTVTALVVAVAVSGYMFSTMPGNGIPAVAPVSDHESGVFPRKTTSSRSLQSSVSELDPVTHAGNANDINAPEVKKIIDDANIRISKGEYDAAIAALNRSRALMQNYPETFLLIGRALEGKKDYAAARDFYNAAIGRNPYLSEAYFGFATTSEAMGDLQSALGAMRSYLHTESDRTPGRLRIAQARSALWEWEAQIGRGPWGPTKGVPPGFAANELRRDGRGVGVKMPISGTEQADGTMKAEIKHADRKQLFSLP